MIVNKAYSNSVDLKKNLDDKFDIITFLYYLAIITVSFDVFLVINIGFNFRIAQILLFFPIIIGVLQSLVTHRIKPPIGFSYLLFWSISIMLFIPNTTLLSRNIGYAFWLVFSIFLIFSTVQLFGTYTRIIKLIKWYIYSYFFISLFGLVQFILPIIKVESPFVTQWWIHGVLPRINGFSYEPSFFATYMIMGWVLSAYLIITKSEIIKGKHLKVIFLIETLVLILSSSRMGWIMMALWYIQFPIKFFLKLFKNELSIKDLKSTSLLLLFSTLMATVVIYMIGFDRVRFLFGGLGLFGESDHSKSIRLQDASDTLQAFLESPLLGYSLGGLPSAIGELRNINVENLEIAKLHEGISVFLEVLAASGIIGFIPFVLYITMLIYKPVSLTRKPMDPEIKKLLKAMVIALVFELIILQFNQNILRPYLWLHIALLSAIYNVARNSIINKCDNDIY